VAGLRRARGIAFGGGAVLVPTAATRLVFLLYLPFIPCGLCLVATAWHTHRLVFARTPRDALRRVVVIDAIRQDFGMGFYWFLIHLIKTR
jgi:hypothetical protein